MQTMEWKDIDCFTPHIERFEALNVLPFLVFLDGALDGCTVPGGNVLQKALRCAHLHNELIAIPRGGTFEAEP